MVTTLKALLVFVLCTSGSGGGEMRVELKVEYMSLTDNFGSQTSLLFSGRKLTFDCGCTPDCGKMTVKRGDSTWADDDPKKQKFPVSLNSSTEFGNYVCSANETVSKEFVLKYLLCDDESEMCNNLKCGKPSNESQYHFCVIKDNNRRNLEVCGVLDKTDCPEDFGKDVVGYPCVDGEYVPSLCEAFAGMKKVEFTAKKIADCKTKDYLKVTSSNGTRIYLGEIGEFGDEVILVCGSSGCGWICDEKTWSSDDKFLTEGGEISGTNRCELKTASHSFVSQIKCRIKKGNPKVETYFFNVQFSAEMNFNRTGGKITCELLKPPFPSQKRLFRHDVKIFRNGEEWNSTKEETKLVTDTSICGNYTCEVSIKFQYCNPFYTKNGSSKSVSPIVVSEECVTPPPSSETTESGDSSSSSSTGIYVSVAVVVLCLFIAIIIDAAAKVKTSPKEKTSAKKSSKSKDRSKDNSSFSLRPVPKLDLPALIGDDGKPVYIHEETHYTKRPKPKRI